MDTEEVDTHSVRLKALLELAKDGTAATHVGRHDVLLDLITGAFPHKALSHDDKVSGLLFVFREVLTAARKALPVPSKGEAKLRKPDEGSKERTDTLVMAAGELLGLNNDEGNVVFEQRCSVGELDELHSFKGRPLGLRQKRAAYWEGNSNDETGRRNTKQYLETFMATVAQYISSQAGHEQLRNHLGPVPVGETGSSRTSYQPPDGSTNEQPQPADLDWKQLLHRVLTAISRFLTWSRDAPLVQFDDEIGDGEPVRPITIRHVFVIAVTAALFYITPASALAMPAYSWVPFTYVDELSQNTPGLFLIVLCFPFCLIALITYEDKMFRKVFGTAFLVVVIALLGVRWANYEFDKGDVDYIAGVKANGSLLGPRDFGKTGNCPAETGDDRFIPLPLASCVAKDGTVHVEMTSSQGLRIGVYPTGDTGFHADAKGGAPAPGYYIDTRFRSDLGSMSACGVEMESNKGELFFRIVWDPLFERYYAELSSVESVPDSPGEIRLVSLVRSDYLLFVGKYTAPVADYTTWTRVTVLLAKEQIMMMVDDRTVLSYPYSGLTDIYRGSVAVTAGSAGSGGVTSCIFDHAEVGTIPLDGY